MKSNLTDTLTYKVIERRDLTENTFVLRFDRNGINFQPGQHILVGRSTDDEMREYSIYSGHNDDFLEILVKEVDDGVVSKQLHKLQPGDPVEVEGAVGFFRIMKEDLDKKFIFLASGTGIAPFHSFAKSYPELDYTILHGIRHSNQAFERDTYPQGRYISCTSKDQKGDFHGHVTDYIQQNKLDKNALIYLCGNSNMILDAKDILEEQGFQHDQIHTEVYF